MASTDIPESFQITLETAEFYEASFVPAFFAQWAPALCEAAGVAPDSRVLDVGCGTGIVARTAADLVGASGAVVGVDLNEAMLTVARRVRPGIDWRQGDAAALPVDDRSFDAVLCQMALMFFREPARAVAAMGRALVPGGHLALIVPGRLDDQTAFAPFVTVAARHAGPEARSLLSAYFVAGDREQLGDLVESTGLRVTICRTQEGTYRAPSVDAFVTTEVESTPLRERISDEVYARIRDDAHEILQPFTTSDGRVEAPFECNIVVAVKA